jgi:type I restriction enzyme M protein
MAEAAFLHCPIRGQLSVPQRAKDRLTFTEEKWRIDALRFLLHRDYPKEHFHIETTLFRFGHEGRNSFRIDFSLYDEPYEDIKHLPINERINLIKVVAEIKRDNKSADKEKAMQVRPALDRLPDIKALGIYWDDIEQRFFYCTFSEDKIETHEAPISKIPPWGAAVGSTRLTYNDLDAASNLVRIFDQLEDALHTYITDKSKRYTVLLQLLLAKIYDENRHKSNKNMPISIQDFFAEAITDSMVIKSMNENLKAALGHYQNYLPERVPTSFGVPSESLRRASQILAPINILDSKKEVIQSFYMKFAKNLYRWDLAQYFTPHEVVDFMVEVTNPGYGEHVKDPACGSADFLISAYRHGSRFAPDFSQCVWGSDHSGQAVQISVLNMLLNGDGRSNVKEEDSI